MFVKLHSSTSKSLSEGLIFASTNPQYDDRLFIELQVQYMKIPSSNMGRTCCVHCFAKRKASDKDLPVITVFRNLLPTILRDIYVSNF